MTTPSLHLNPDGNRIATFKWSVEGPPGSEFAKEVKKLADYHNLELLELNVEEKGFWFLKNSEETNFRVKGLESAMHKFFSKLQKGMEQYNSEVDEQVEKKPKKKM